MPAEIDRDLERSRDWLAEGFAAWLEAVPAGEVVGIAGNPDWTPDVYGSALEAPEAELAQTWSAIPSGLDVLMVHCPPRDHGDEPRDDGAAVTLMGSLVLVAAIERTGPRLVLYGHAHQAHGCRAEHPREPGSPTSACAPITGGLGSVSELSLTVGS